MKTLKVLILTVFVISLSGCKYKKESERLQTENQNLTSRLAQSDSTLREYLSIINDIETRLESILAADETPEQRAIEEDLRTKLANTATAVNNLFRENEQKYQSLRNSYYSRNTKVKELETENEKLNLLIGKQDSTIKSINEKIAALNGTIDEQNSKISDLSNDITAQKDTINMVTNSLNTAYFVSGIESDLRDKNIIIKTGGCMGIFGRVNALNPGLNSSGLEKIDISERTTFSINSDLKSIEFITPRPSGSYEIKEVSPGSVEIRVTDPVKFWEFSKYLVIAI